MKKIFTLVVALCTLTAVHATYYLHESFEQAEGKLVNTMFTDENLTDWMQLAAGAPDSMVVVNKNLTFAGYATTGVGNCVQYGINSELNGSRLAIRNIVPQDVAIKSGSCYAAAIIKVDSLHVLTANDDYVTQRAGYLFALGDEYKNAYARLYARTVNDEAGKPKGYQLGIGKYTEALDQLKFAETVYNTSETHLVVVEYVFVDGVYNDSINLFVDPSVDTTVPTLVNVYENKGDISSISRFILSESSCQQGKVFIDEIKVATDWASLFNEAAEPIKLPVLAVTPAYPSFTKNDEPMEVDSTYTTTITITGQNLTGDVTLSSTRPDELTLSKTTLTKAEIEADGGVEVVLTAKPTAIAANEEVNISLTDADSNVLKAISITWTAIKPVICKTIAELNAAMKDATGEAALTLNFTGEAIVTYSFVVPSKWGMPSSMVILQDATGACLMDRSGAFFDFDYETDIETDLLPVGAKVTGLDLTDYTNGKILFLMPNQSSQQKNFEVLGTGEITPKVVTPAELKNHPFELVTLQNVTFTPEATVTKFDIAKAEADANGMGSAVLVDLKQGETIITANVSAATSYDWETEVEVPESNLIGTTIPTDPADVTGIVWAADEIRLRSTADIKAATTAIHNAALSSEEDIEKFVRDGQLIIRMNGVEYNVLGAKLQ